MRTIYLYEAFDGKRFDNEDECMNYEAVNFHPNVFKIIFIDKDNNIYPIDKNDIFNDNIYQKCEEIYIPNEESLKDLLWLAEECGWEEFYDFSKPGHWKRSEDLKTLWLTKWTLID